MASRLQTRTRCWVSNLVPTSFVALENHSYLTPRSLAKKVVPEMLSVRAILRLLHAPIILTNHNTDFMKKSSDSSTLDVLVFWDILQKLLIPIWPQDRTNVSGQPLGDAWPLSTLKTQSSSPSADETDFIQPFHKLTQWLAYSLMVPFTRILSLQWKNASSLTALPEYRNGGLFVDLGVLTLKPASLERGIKASSDGTGLPAFSAGDDVIVEWRAMTLVLVDKLYKLVLQRMEGVDLSMAQLLEAGTWKSGREVAKEKRPATKSSPIIILSDGTVF